MKKIIVTLMVIVCVILFGCNDEKTEQANDKKSNVQWAQHMIMYSNGDTYTYYSINDESIRKSEPLVLGNILYINSDKQLLLYQDIDSKVYYLSKDGNKQKLNIKDQIKKCQVSPDGEKILYSVEKEDGSVSYYLYSVQKNNSSELVDLIISGDMYFWKDKDSLIFYGIDGENKGGIFEYNLDTKKINKSLIIKGIVEKFVEDNGAFVYIVNNNDKRKTYMLDPNEFKEKLVSDKIQKIGDIYYNGKELYFTGLVKDNVYSLYRTTLNQGNSVRLIYDFPNGVVEDKKILGLGNAIILVGHDDDKNELVARYNIKEKAIEILVDNQGQYDILY
ncbi:hypothetical protein JHL18_10280 [Clostridium sp. YIM B02505]|uniref:Lipoprotein n=1 Tax=Clostridium yunnanense TaxID=2800325 RepID=A0ABS1ENQ5_9CLOT|nr:hypothetical protein [Clostridium yunnanense]MBK1811014.1 hypothetical protein [Clostridium yunnanense]